MTVLFLTTEIVKFLSHILLIKLYLQNEKVQNVNGKFSLIVTILLHNRIKRRIVLVENEFSERIRVLFVKSENSLIDELVLLFELFKVFAEPFSGVSAHGDIFELIEVKGSGSNFFFDSFLLRLE